MEYGRSAVTGTGMSCRLAYSISVGARVEVPLAPRRDHAQLGRERGVGQLEAHLVVALAGGAVGHRVGAFRRATSTWALAMSGRAIEVPEQVAALVDRVGAQHREDEVADELLAQVDDVHAAGAGRERLLADGISSSPCPRSAQNATTSQR